MKTTKLTLSAAFYPDNICLAAHMNLLKSDFRWTIQAESHCSLLSPNLDFDSKILSYIFGEINSRRVIQGV